MTQTEDFRPTPPAPVISPAPEATTRPHDRVSDPLRIASLHRARLLDTTPEESFDRLTKLAARILGAPVALVSLVDEDRQFFKSAVGLSGDLQTQRETPLSHSYCRHVITSGEALVVNDARKDPLLRDNPAITDHGSISYCGVPVVDLDGRALGTLCVIDQNPRVWTDDQVETLREIAEAVIAEVHVRLLAADLDDVNRGLREFIATASHDLRNPLAVIMMYAQLLEDDVSVADRQDFAREIHSAGRHASTLVSDLLEISKIDAGALQPNTSPLAVYAAIERVRSRPTSGAIEANVPSETCVLVDADHFHRMLSNLVDNAIHYGGTPITIEVVEGQDEVMIAVTDCGKGVPPAFVPRLFERFSRSDESRKSRQEGTGLGLAIVAGLAAANGGSIRYEPNQPQGSRFILTLPRAA